MYIIIILLVLLVFLFVYYDLLLSKKIQYLNLTRDVLYNVSEKVSNSDEECEIYKYILDAAVELIPYATKGSVIILEEDGQFHFKALNGYNENIKKISLSQEELYLSKINNFKNTAIIDNPQRFDEDNVHYNKVDTLKNYRAIDIFCTISSPIYIDNKLMGVVNVDSDKKSKTFNEKDAKLMNHIKNELQLALKNTVIRNRLTYMANYDELTGLFNRRYIKHLLGIEIENINNGNACACIAFIDIDNFKLINDTYGHDVGDKTLRAFSDVLRENIKVTDIYGRLSGDEFLILYKNCSINTAETRINEIKNKLRHIDIKDATISFSYGLYFIDDSNKLSNEEILKNVDEKMYLNKKSKYDSKMKTILNGDNKR